MTRRETRSGRSTASLSPIGPPQSWTTTVVLAQVELVGEAFDRAVVEVVGVVLDPGRLVGTAEAEVVGRDGASRPRDRRDHRAVEERPRRLAVQEQHRIAAPLVDVVHPQPVLLDVVRVEGVPGKAFEALVGRAIRLQAREYRARHTVLGGFGLS